MDQCMLDPYFVRRLANDWRIAQAVRVMFFAMLRVDPNGIAVFEQGELGGLLRMPDEAKRPEVSVLRAIDAAERRGYIVKGSMPIRVLLDTNKVRRVSE